MYRFIAASALLSNVAAQSGNPIPLVTAACASPIISTQQFATNADGTITSAANGQCITSLAGSAMDNLVLHPCGNGTQKWTRGADGSVAVSPSNGLCWNGDGSPPNPIGTSIILYNCGSRDLPVNDIFTFEANGNIQLEGMCLDVTPPPKVWPWVAGRLAGPDAIPSAPMALEDAKALCTTSPACWGITWQGPLQPSTNETFFFKTQTQPQTADGWQSLLACGVFVPCPLA